MTKRDLALTLLIMALWSLNGVVIRIGALEVPPLSLLAVRLALGAIIFLPFAKRIDHKTFKNISLYAIIYVAAHLSTLFVALKYVDASLASLITQTEVVFGVLIGWIFFGERFGSKTALGMITALIGVITILYHPGDANFTYFGAALLLLCSLCWVLGSIRMRYIQHVDIATMTGVAYAVACPLIAILSLIFESNQLQEFQNADPLKIAFVLTYQIILMSLCLYWWKDLMNRNPVYIMTSFVLTMPVFTTIFGYIILGETLSNSTAFGGALVLGGVAIITTRKFKKKEI